MNRIQILRNSDLPHLLELSAQAGWNQTASDWARTLALAPEGSLGIEADGRIVACTTAIRYAT